MVQARSSLRQQRLSRFDILADRTSARSAARRHAPASKSSRSAGTARRRRLRLGRVAAETWKGHVDRRRTTGAMPGRTARPNRDTDPEIPPDQRASQLETTRRCGSRIPPSGAGRTTKTKAPGVEAVEAAPDPVDTVGQRRRYPSRSTAARHARGAGQPHSPGSPSKARGLK